MCKVEISAFYGDPSIALTQNILWDYNSLCHVRHEAISMSWIPADAPGLDLNTKELEHIYISPNIQAFYRDHVFEISCGVTHSSYVAFYGDVKVLCKGNLHTIIFFNFFS